LVQGDFTVEKFFPLNLVKAAARGYAHSLLIVFINRECRSFSNWLMMSRHWGDEMSAVTRRKTRNFNF